MKRIDSLLPMTLVNLKFHPKIETEPALFLVVTGEGDDRTAHFRSTDEEGKSYDWQAYRYQGRWAYGTSADRLSLHSEVSA